MFILLSHYSILEVRGKGLIMEASPYLINCKTWVTCFNRY